MHFRSTVVSLLVATAVPSSALYAQTHIVGLIGGFSTSREAIKSGFSGLFLPDAGVTSTLEFNRLLSIGVEARYVRKRVLTSDLSADLRLDYLETPLFVRIGDPRADERSQPFVRLGVAPAIEVRCVKPADRTGPRHGSRNPNQPESGSLIGVGYPRQTQPDLSNEIACFGARQRKLDIGWLGAIGRSFRSDRHMFALELRGTIGARSLSDDPAVSLKNRTFTLLMSTGTRLF